MIIKGLIFDLDGVLTETAKFHYQAWKNEVKKIGINFTKEQNSILKGIPRIETLIEILKLHNMKNKFSKKEILKMANNKNKEYQKLIKNKLNKNHILPGIKKILNEAKKNNLKMAIASSSFNAILILKKINLIDYFDYIVDPSSIKKGKPEPDIFLKACKGINIKPSEALGFEDSISGIIGLKKAKIKTIAITHNEIGEWEKADIVVSSTNEIKLKKYI